MAPHTTTTPTAGATTTAAAFPSGASGNPLARKRRRQLERAVDATLALLDELDGDPDLDDGDEDTACEDEGKGLYPPG